MSHTLTPQDYAIVADLIKSAQPEVEALYLQRFVAADEEQVFTARPESTGPAVVVIAAVCVGALVVGLSVFLGWVVTR